MQPFLNKLCISTRNSPFALTLILLPLNEVPSTHSLMWTNFPNSKRAFSSSMWLKKTWEPMSSRSSTSTTSRPSSLPRWYHLKMVGSIMDWTSPSSKRTFFRVFRQCAGASPSPYPPANISNSCSFSSPGRPPDGCLQNSLPEGRTRRSLCMKAFFRSPTAANHPLDAQIWRTMDSVAVVTVGACLSRSNRSGSLSPLTHHLDFLEGGAPGWSAGFRRLTILEGSTLDCNPASCSCLKTSSESSLLKALTAPVASTLDHSAPPATFHFSHSSAPCMSFSWTSSDPLLTMRLTSAGILLRVNSVNPIHHLMAASSLLPTSPRQSTFSTLRLPSPKTLYVFLCEVRYLIGTGHPLVWLGVNVAFLACLWILTIFFLSSS